MQSVAPARAIFVQQLHSEECDPQWPGYLCNPDPTFKRILDMVIFSFWRNLTTTDQDDLHIILIVILRGFWIWSQKFEILSMAHNIAIFVHFRKI